MRCSELLFIDVALLLVLPREGDILSRRRADDPEDDAPIMHALDSDVFNYCCRHTDWSTGRIGERSKLSYAGIALALTEDIPRKPNRSLRIVKRRCVRNSVERLIKVGLFRSQSVSENTAEANKNRLILDRVFWGQLLQQGRNEMNTDSQQLAGLVSELLKNNSFNNSELTDYLSFNRVGSYRPVGIYKTNTLTNAKNDRFCLFLTWQPERKFVNAFLKASGFAGDQIEKIWFGKYVQYWSSQKIMRSQREWSTHFASHMQSYLLRPGYFEEVNGIVVD